MERQIRLLSSPICARTSSMTIGSITRHPASDAIHMSREPLRYPDRTDVVGNQRKSLTDSPSVELNSSRMVKKRWRAETAQVSAVLLFGKPEGGIRFSRLRIRPQFSFVVG